MKEQLTFIDRLLKRRVLTHVLFWLGLLVGTTFLEGVNHGRIKSHLANAVVLFPIQLIATYLLVYYQYPKLFLKKKYLRFFFFFLLSVLVLTLIARLGIIYISEPLYRTDFLQESFWDVLSDPGYLLVVYFPTIYSYTFLFGAVKAVKVRFEEKHQLEVLKKEKVSTELKFLKAQIHPHFLFNTLNNLYALTLEKSDAAPEVVVKLSEMLDYMLYQCTEPTVAIHKEVALIQNYIDLELLRYGEKMDLQFHQDIDDLETPIAPLILLSIVENAFKHGASGNLVNPKVHIHLKVSEGQVDFEVYNTKPTKGVDEKRNHGMGTTNVERQLDLIYGADYELKVENRVGDYRLKLRIGGVNGS